MMKGIALTIASLLAAIFFWPYAVAGIGAFLVSGLRFNRWISSVCALLAASCWRIAVGEWAFQVGGGSFAGWDSEVIHGILNWGLGAIFVSAFAQLPEMLVDRYKSASIEKYD
jgi:hypothetical protein